MINQGKKVFQAKLIRTGFLAIILSLCFLYFDAEHKAALTLSVDSLSEVDIAYDKAIMHKTLPTILQEEPTAKETPKRSHAPEPSTILMVLSGVGAAVIRFARRSFDKFKRLFDIVVSLIGLILSLPILAVTAILIKLSSRGPVIFKQKRLGKGGEIFDIYKLRTMVVNAEEGTGAVWARENDPRITMLGRFMRKTHIDEIPQLINVLRGEMSIIGPRPERPELVPELSKHIKQYRKRLKVKPGITGLAQVWHKYDETVQDVKKKIKYDLLYIRKMCLLVDLRILLRTVLVVMTGRGAR